MKFVVSFFLFISLFAAMNLPAKDKMIGVYYLKPIYGHLHQNPSRFSSSITTLSCGHPIKVMRKSEGKNVREMFNKSWRYVKVGPYEGYLEEAFLSRTQVICPQDSYSKFFDGLSLEITDMYYWGRLQDLYVRGKSSVR